MKQDGLNTPYTPDYAKLANELAEEAELMTAPEVKPEVRALLSRADELMRRAAVALRAAERALKGKNELIRKLSKGEIDRVESTR